MAATRVGSTIVVTGTTTISETIDVEAVANNSTTSVTISDGTTTFLTLGNTKDVIFAPFRLDGGCVVTVVGGGSITLFLRIR